MGLKIFQYFREKKVELKLKNNVFHLFEDLKYQIEFFSKEEIKNNKIYINNSSINSDDFEVLDSHHLRTKPSFFFLNTFGYSNLKIDENNFQLQVDATKITAKEAEKLLFYLYQKDKNTLSNFYSKSSFDKDEITVKNLKPIQDFIYEMEKLIFCFDSMPYFKWKKEEKIVNYPSPDIDEKSVLWLSQNLHHLHFDNSYMNLPDSIRINNKYGVIEKIAVNKNVEDFNIYENKIILGGIFFVKNLVDKIDIFLNDYKKSKKKFFQNEYASYKSILSLVHREANFDLLKIRTRTSFIFDRYKKIFKDVKYKNEMPRYSSAVNRIKHYRMAFSAIQKIRKTNLNLENKNISMGINSIDKLYEHYNYYRLIDIAKSYFSFGDFEFKTRKNKKLLNEKFTVKSIRENCTVNIYYEPEISTEAKELKLVKIGHLMKRNKYIAKPDFVIEFIKNNVYRYAILDAKYRRNKNVINEEIKETTYKYIMAFGIENQVYKKPDFLWLVYPDTYEDQTVWQQNFNDNYFPIIGAVTSKPNLNQPLKNVFNKIMKKWGVIRNTFYEFENKKYNNF